MVKVIKEIQSILDVPLQIDSTNAKAIEMGLRYYNGKAIVNSVNGENKVLENILPIVKKYGAAVVGLTLDDRGIPSSGEERFRIAEKIVKTAESYGIDKKDIYIDCLTLTAAAQQEDVKETLKALSLVKEKLNVKTVLGVSNVSFGLPNREILNKTFLAASLFAGLDLPIINPLNKDIMDTIVASKVLWNEDKGAKEYLKYNENISKEQTPIKKDVNNIQDDLFKIISKGIKEEAQIATVKLLENKQPLEIVNEYIIPALDDIHDIGKNIVKVLLENYNYEIIDLGKDVSKEKIVEAVIKNNVKLIGLSALMTTTVKNMEETIYELKSAKPDCVVMVGGAVLNEEYANMIKADFYAKDAKESVTIARKVLG